MSVASHLTGLTCPSAGSGSCRYWYSPEMRPTASTGLFLSGITTRSPTFMRSRNAQSWPVRFGIAASFSVGYAARTSSATASRVVACVMSATSAKPPPLTPFLSAHCSRSPARPARISQACVISVHLPVVARSGGHRAHGSPHLPGLADQLVDHPSRECGEERGGLRVFEHAVDQPSVGVVPIDRVFKDSETTAFFTALARRMVYELVREAGKV